MKTIQHAAIFRSTLLATLALFVVGTGVAQTNKPGVKMDSNSDYGVDGSRAVSLYEIDFPGGSPKQFFRFWQTNGFQRDSVLFAGDVGLIHIPPFKIRDARLSEVAKSIEFVTEEQLRVEIVEKVSGDRGNIWRVKAMGLGASADIKTKACALPNLLSQTDGEKKVITVYEGALRALVESHARLRTRSRPEGTFNILREEKIVVVSGSEPYVEALISTLQAAEAAAAVPSKQ